MHWNWRWLLLFDWDDSIGIVAQSAECILSDMFASEWANERAKESEHENERIIFAWAFFKRRNATKLIPNGVGKLLICNSFIRSMASFVNVFFFCYRSLSNSRYLSIELYRFQCATFVIAQTKKFTTTIDGDVLKATTKLYIESNDW